MNEQDLHGFTQDPLDVVQNKQEGKCENNFEQHEQLPKLSAPKNQRKTVSIRPNVFEKDSQMNKTRNLSVSHSYDLETTPLLHPSLSLPTIVDFSNRNENALSSLKKTTRSEIGQKDLSRKKQRRKEYSNYHPFMKKSKPRPYIISPFMPISTQVSVDVSRNSSLLLKKGYGTTTTETENLRSDSPHESDDSDEESDASNKESSLPFIKSTIKNVSLLSSRQLLTISMLSLANLCSTIAFSCIAPFYPTEAKQKQLSETQIGIVFGVFELTMFIISPIFGKYIIAIGARKMFIVGIAVTGLTAILFGFLNYLPSGETFFWFSVLVRVLEAVGDSAFVTSSFAIAAKSFPRNVAFVVGLLETFAGLGYTAGPVIGGFFYDIGGFQLPFLVLGVVLLIASVLAFLLIQNTKDDENNSEDRGMFEILKLPKIWLPIFSVVACAISLSFLDPTLSSHLESFNLTPTEVGLMFLLCGGFYTIMSLVFGSIMDVYQIGDFLLLFGSVATLLSMLFIGPSPLISQFVEKNIFVIGVSLAVLGLAASALYIPCFQMCLDEVKEKGFEDNFNTYGCVSGIFQAAFGFGSFIGPTLGSVVVEKIGFRWTTSTIAMLHVILTVTVVITLTLKKCRKQQ